jgi:succinate dehydrogenase / fumarate reductase, membrane anchor subunit
VDYRTPLNKVRGLGTAHNGFSHWWLQRITAVILIPLSFWLIAYCKHLLSATHGEISHWLAQPFNSVAALIWTAVVSYHAALGLQVVIEDYVHSSWQKITAVWTVKLFFFGLAVGMILMLLQIAG